MNSGRARYLYKRVGKLGTFFVKINNFYEFNLTYYEGISA